MAKRKRIFTSKNERSLMSKGFSLKEIRETEKELFPKQQLRRSFINEFGINSLSNVSI